jgi:hypothetical protein
MAFELDPCAVHTATGELVARGFVREQAGDTEVVEMQHESGAWLGDGDEAILEVFSATRGALTYDGVVEFAAARRVGLRGLRLREAVQQRSAVRVPSRSRSRRTPSATTRSGSPSRRWSSTSPPTACGSGATWS